MQERVEIRPPDLSVKARPAPGAAGGQLRLTATLLGLPFGLCALPQASATAGDTVATPGVVVDSLCGMSKFAGNELEDRLRDDTGMAPISPATFYSFTDVEQNTREQVQKARSHPWISPEVPVRGFISDVNNGRLTAVFPDGTTVTGE